MKKIFILMAGFLLMSANLYAGNGDLIVNGNVGIGTTAPLSKLHAAGTLTVGGGATAYTVGNVQITTGGASPISNRLTYGTDGTGWKFAIGKNQAGTITDQLTIQDNGNVGIGTSNPAYRLHVMGITYSYGGYQSSDIKYKKDITQIDSALDKVNNLTGYSYLYKTDEYKDKNFPEGKQLGVIAQELEKVIPEAVMTDEEGTKAVNYSMIIPVLIEAIKAQQKEIDDLQSTVTQLQSKSK